MTRIVVYAHRYKRLSPKKKGRAPDNAAAVPTAKSPDTPATPMPTVAASDP